MTRRSFLPVAAVLSLGSCVLPALEVNEDVPEPGEAGSPASGGGGSGAGKGGGSGKGGSAGKGGSGGSDAGSGGVSAGGGAGGSDLAGSSGSSSGTGGSSGGSAGVSGAGGGDAGTGGGGAGMGASGGNAGSGGTPVTCDGELTDCSGSCRDLSSDRYNCGECGMGCAGVIGCFDGQCGCDPAAPDAGAVTLCADKCSVLGTDPENCGECGTKCGVGEICEMGVCVSECTPAVAGPPMLEEIDDLEDGDTVVGNYNPSALEAGYWWFAHDDSAGMFTPDPFVMSSPGRSSSYAAAVSGSGFTDWGSNMGFSLHSPNSIACPIDGSDFRGISFAYRAAHPFSVRISTADSTPRPSGGCPIAAAYCFNTYRAGFPASVEWIDVEVLWEALELEPGAPAFDPRTLVSITFDFLGDASFDLAVDDIAFVY